MEEEGGAAAEGEPAGELALAKTTKSTKTPAGSYLLPVQAASDGVAPVHGVGSRVAAVGPYIQSSSSQGPPVPARQEVLVKPAYPDGTATLPMPDSSLKPPPRPAKPASGAAAGASAGISRC